MIDYIILIHNINTPERVRGKQMTEYIWLREQGYDHDTAMRMVAESEFSLPSIEDDE